MRSPSSMSKSEKFLVIIQARTTSSRLPGKVLLPISGIPSACLSALRAGNTGLNVIVATSEEKTDDELVEILRSYSITCFRGSLNNVHDRFRKILLQREEVEVVVRLTADNLLPDGNFIEKMISDFVSSGTKYLAADMESMPYGLSAEVFSKQHFLSIDPETLSTEEKEHVTSKLRKQFSKNLFSRNEYSSQFHLRCTIDYLKDYEEMCSLFESVKYPIEVQASELVYSLEKKKFSPERLSLGTVQLGLEYGINNVTGRPNKKEAFKILSAAYDGGIRHLDTARAYGGSEEIIGSFSKAENLGFAVNTKLSPLLDTTNEKNFLSSIKKSLHESLELLGQSRISSILFHRTEHLELFGGVGLHTLLELTSSLGIKGVGASISSPNELRTLKKFNQLSHLQLPFNIVDHRWQAELEFFQNFNLNGRIQTRSLFLQGLLLMEISDVPAWIANGEEFRRFCSKLRLKGDLKETLMSFVESEFWIDQIIIGAESAIQIKEIIKLQNNLDVIDQSLKDEIIKMRPSFSEELLNPSKWNES